MCVECGVSMVYAWCVCGVIYGVHMYVWYGVCVVCCLGYMCS